MSKISGRKNLTAILSIVTIGATLSFGMAEAVAAEDVTEDQILRALAPPAKKPLTRGLSVGPQQAEPVISAEEGRFVQKIRGRSTRSLSASEREEIATLAKDKPNIDLEITFDYNSAEISAKSLPSVQALGKALTSPDLKGSTFIVAGHTDAAGSDGLQPGPVGAARRLDQALSDRQIRHRRRRPRDRRIRREQAQGSRASRWRKPTAACRSSTWPTRPPRPGNSPAKRIVALCRVFHHGPPFRSRSERRLCVYLTHFPGASRYPLRRKTL